MCYVTVFLFFCFFFFKQKTAYEIMPSLVGSEMCIRDSYTADEIINMNAEDYSVLFHPDDYIGMQGLNSEIINSLNTGKYHLEYEYRMISKSGDLKWINANYYVCLLYTSDAADDMQCVDLGGRRILEKKKIKQNI
eukprot:TRINITY_DN16084_c0_g1_i2.p1 TRINITY_DN16084_c0_g1~~TRINITY_DN16084_c0_g1_i2.p1  ORF type:complete len:136 (-),score=33.66 TRINITY_DN16084_c0_g1_i2:40-447(-)